MMKKKLLITTDCFLPRWDGIARFLTEIIPRLTDHFAITVVAPDFVGKAPHFPDVEVIRVPLGKFQFGDYLAPKYRPGLIKKLVKQHDIVFNQTIGPIGFAGVRAASKLNKPLVTYIHSIEWELFSKSVKHCKGFVEWLVKVVTKRLYNKCDLLLVPAAEVGRIMESVGIHTKKEVVHLGTDTKKFTPPEMKVKAKRDIGIDPKYTVIGFCGRISREKDLPTLHKAFKILGRKRTDMMLLIVGSGLQEEEQRLFRGRHVMLTGTTDNVVPYLQAMDIFVLPSHTETTSLATLEAMSCGLPVVVTKVGYLRKYIEDEKNGLFFETENPQDLAHKLSMLMERPMLMQQLGKTARETVIKKFNWNETAPLIAEALKSSSSPLSK